MVQVLKEFLARFDHFQPKRFDHLVIHLVIVFVSVNSSFWTLLSVCSCRFCCRYVFVSVCERVCSSDDGKHDDPFRWRFLSQARKNALISLKIIQNHCDSKKHYINKKFKFSTTSFLLQYIAPKLLFGSIRPNDNIQHDRSKDFLFHCNLQKFHTDIDCNQLFEKLQHPCDQNCFHRFV